MRYITAFLMATLLLASVSEAQSLDPKDVHITLDQALPIALQKASTDFPDLNSYILYSANPRILLGDSKGLHWQFTWQEKAFPHYKMLVVRVYMKDGSSTSERFEKGTYQKENDNVLKP